jgi:hypothetical protein
MSKKLVACAIAASFVAGGIAGGFAVPGLLAAAEPVETMVGGGAPAKVLVENDKVKVTLVSYDKGFVRKGGMARGMDQVIVYIDDGDFTVPPRPGAAPQPAGPRPRTPESSIRPDGTVANGGLHERGTVAWHPKGSNTPTLNINKPYRVVFVEMK